MDAILADTRNERKITDPFSERKGRTEGEMTPNHRGAVPEISVVRCVKLPPCDPLLAGRRLRPTPHHTTTTFFSMLWQDNLPVAVAVVLSRHPSSVVREHMRSRGRVTTLGSHCVACMAMFFFLLPSVLFRRPFAAPNHSLWPLVLPAAFRRFLRVRAPNLPVSLLRAFAWMCTKVVVSYDQQEN